MNAGTRQLAACLSLLLVAIAAVPKASGQERNGEQRVVTRVLGDDLFAAGQRLRVVQDSPGDAILAGAELDLDGAIGGDVVAAGRRVLLRSAVSGDLYAAGGELRIEGTIAGNARVAGGRVELEPEAEVAGAMSAAGNEVGIDGSIGSYLQIAAQKAWINGHVGGDVEVSGASLEIGPQAVIDGAVTFRGPAPAQVVDGAQVRGGVHHIARQGRGGDDMRRHLRTAFSVGAWLWLAGWLIVGCVLIAAAPGLTGAITQTVRKRPGWSVLGGVLVLIGAPLLGIVLMVTLVGIPLALLLLAAYLIWLPLGYLVAAATLGEWMALRLRAGHGSISRRDRILAFCGVLILLFLLVRIPVAGKLLGALVLLAGMGGLVLALFDRRRGNVAAALP